MDEPHDPRDGRLAVAGRAPSSPRAVPRPSRPELDRRFTTASVVAVAVVLVYAYVALSPTLSTGMKEAFSDVMLIPLAGAAALASASTARRAEGRTATAWWWLTASATSWMVAEALYLVEKVLSGGGTGGVALSDAFYLAGTACALVALGGFYPRTPGRVERLHHVVAALVIAGAMLFLFRLLVLPDVLASVVGSPLEQAVLVAYPVSDVVLASVTLIVLARVAAGSRLHVGLLAAGFLTYAASDTMYAVLDAAGAYESGAFGDIGWVAGYLLFALAALAPRAAEPTDGADRALEHPGGLSAVIVYVPVGAAVVVASWHGVPRDDGLLLGSGAVVIALFGLRQYLAARDTMSLNATLAARVDELQATSAALRRLAQQNERTVQSVSEGIFGVDAKGVVTFANPPAALMLGRKLSGLVGRAEHELFHASRPDLPAGDCLIRRALHSGQPTQSADETFVRGDGTRFPVELAVGPVVENGSIQGAVIVFRDITQRRQVEKMKDEFISVVSHELRTPLTAIRGSLGLMAGGAIGALPDRAHRLVGLALESTERLTRLINDMLDIERIESGTTTMTFGECDAAELVRTAVDGVRSLASEVGVALEVGPTSGLVHADGDRIVQTLTNLIGNAIKFSPPHTTITVAAHPEGDVVQFSVTDQGRGIPEDKLERIFERFEQVDSSDSRQKGGTGLGLSISRTIVRRHGGRIWVHSEMGVGSTFYFTLQPARPEHAAAEAALATPDGAAGLAGAGPEVASAPDPVRA